MRPTGNCNPALADDVVVGNRILRYLYGLDPGPINENDLDNVSMKLIQVFTLLD